MSRVKVTNITHQAGTVGPSSGVCIKFMDADLMPGQSILISMEQLPSEWKNMRNAFEFQFLGDESSITNQNTVVNQNVDLSLHVCILDDERHFGYANTFSKAQLI